MLRSSRFRRYPHGFGRHSTAIGVVSLLLTAITASALAQDAGGISSVLISRCAGKLGAGVREGDAAFPLFSLDGAPWVSIRQSVKNSGDARIATTVTGTGTRHRRRGEVVNFQYTCLLDDSGAAVSFKSSDLLPERG